MFSCIAYLVTHEPLSLAVMTSLFPVKVPCGACKKLFNNAWFLNQHELHIHSGERKKLSCPKEGCDKKFTHRFNLESHVLGDHEGKKPFSCAFAGCGKSFAMKVNLHSLIIWPNHESSQTSGVQSCCLIRFYLQMVLTYALRHFAAIQQNNNISSQ